MSKIRNILQILGIFLIASCNREEVTENGELPSDDKIAVNTEISVDGVDITGTDTRASSEAGYTTGDGLYDKDDEVTVAAYANSGYELVSFYDKKSPSTNLGSSYEFPAKEPRTFKAEFRKVANYTITVTAGPSAGGSVTGGGSYKGGSSCTVKATPNSGYTFAGWYENGTRVSADASYSFTVSSNRTMTAKFTVKADPILYVTIVDKDLDERGGSLGYLDSGEMEERVSGGYLIRSYKIYAEEDGNMRSTLKAMPESDNKFLGWYDQNRNLIFTSPNFDDQDVDMYRQQHIYAAFSGEATPDGAPSQVTIKLYANKANSTMGGKGKVGFSSGSLSYTTQTKVVKYGEKITIYAEGDEMQIDDYNTTYYYCVGFYLNSGASLTTYTDNIRLHSYTFIATRDMDISAGWKKYD